MPTPTTATYSLAARIAAHTELRDLLDAGTGPGLIRIRSAADVLLAEIVLGDPCGTVSGTTGRLTISVAGPDTGANASGVAAYAEFCDSAGVVHLAMPAQAGTSAISGYAVLNTTTIVEASPVDVISAVIG